MKDTPQLLGELGSLITTNIQNLELRRYGLEVVAELRRRDEEARKMINEIRTELEGLQR